jgi:hypothetical protein
MAKEIFYKIRKSNGSFLDVKGQKVSSLVGARKENDKWIVDHIPTGGRIFVCDSFLEAKIIGLAFFQACSKAASKEPKEVLDNTDKLFKNFLYDHEYKRFVNFIGYKESCLK